MLMGSRKMIGHTSTLDLEVISKRAKRVMHVADFLEAAKASVEAAKAASRQAVGALPLFLEATADRAGLNRRQERLDGSHEHFCMCDFVDAFRGKSRWEEKEVQDPPLVIKVWGNCDLMPKPSLLLPVVPSRMATHEAAAVAVLPFTRCQCSPAAEPSESPGAPPINPREVQSASDNTNCRSATGSSALIDLELSGHLRTN